MVIIIPYETHKRAAAAASGNNIITLRVHEYTTRTVYVCDRRRYIILCALQKDAAAVGYPCRGG